MLGFRVFFGGDNAIPRMKIDVGLSLGSTVGSRNRQQRSWC